MALKPGLEGLKQVAAMKMKDSESPKEDAMESPKMEAAEGDMPAPPQHEIEHAANTLMKAEEIKQNGALMNHVNKHLAKKKHVINSIQKLRAKANSMNQPSAMSPMSASSAEPSSESMGY